MNISKVQFNGYVSFGAKIPDKAVKVLENLPTDIFEVMVNKSKTPPEKFGFTEVEEVFKPVYVKYRSACMNASSQKADMRYYYTPQSKEDYQEIMREKRALLAKLRRIAKNAGMSENDLMFSIDLKNQYNRNSSKISKARTKDDFKNAEELISSNNLYLKTRELLTRLLDRCKSLNNS